MKNLTYIFGILLAQSFGWSQVHAMNINMNNQTPQQYDAALKKKEDRENAEIRYQLQKEN
jgi:hypothetical protein